MTDVVFLTFNFNAVGFKYFLRLNFDFKNWCKHEFEDENRAAAMSTAWEFNYLSKIWYLQMETKLFVFIARKVFIFKTEHKFMPLNLFVQ